MLWEPQACLSNEENKEDCCLGVMGTMDMFPNVTPPLLSVAFVESQHASNNIIQINENIL
jgi:hypothetical protein